MRLLSFISTAATFISTPTSAAAEEQPYFNDSAYDDGKYSSYPIHKYKSSNVIAPRINIVQQSWECDHSLLTFLSPRGYYDEARNPRAVILNSEGGLIWSGGWEDKQIYNLRAQTYKKDDYITFWAGNDAVGGHGAGTYYMLDNTYSLKHTIEAANGLQGDLHEFLITDDDTALITVYQVVQHDLTPLGKSIGPIWDCLIQELNIETGELLFEWRAAHHLNVSDTYRPIGGEGEPNGAAFDWFHINSIDKDLEGNYLISSRYLHSITKVDGQTGEVIWTLGGKRNMFEDLSNGRATDFAFQHDARWTKNYGEITVFDNTDDGQAPDTAHPRGLSLKVDQETMSVALVREYKNPRNFTAVSQGSMQNLDNGNVLLGYGFSAAFTEFDHDGAVLCDSHFGPESQFGTGGVQSYRVLKLPWHGMPTADPDLVVAQDDDGIWSAYFSWNGATEVAEWLLQGTDDPEDVEEKWKTLGTSRRTGFETSILLQANHPSHLRVVALDWMSNILGMSKTANSSIAEVMFTVALPGVNATKLTTFSHLARAWMLASMTLGCVALLIGLGLAPVLKAWKRYQARHKLGEYYSLTEDMPKRWSEYLA